MITCRNYFSAKQYLLHRIIKCDNNGIIECYFHHGVLVLNVNNNNIYNSIRNTRKVIFLNREQTGNNSILIIKTIILYILIIASNK